MTTDSTLRLLACQIDIPFMTCADDRDAHLSSTTRKIKESLAQEHVDLVVLPELSSIDYSRAAFDHLDSLAESLDGPSFQCWSAVAREFGCYVAYGLARRNGCNFFITMAVVDSRGQLVGYYDKIHLVPYGELMETAYFECGDRLLVFTINGFRVAPIICYDIRFPELSRTLAIERRADLILHCGAYYRDESFFTWHNFAIVRAVENQVYFLSLNRAGTDYGNSFFCRPWIDEHTLPIIFPEHEEILRKVKIDRGEIDRVRRKIPYLTGRHSNY